MPKACAIFILFATGATAQIVEGNITDSASGAGIARVAVHLEPAPGSDSDAAFDTMTDALGHFVFERVKAGPYQFSYFAPVWLRTEATPFPQIQVTASGNPLKLEGRMTAMPSISGRLVDGNGNGVAGGLVRIDGSGAKMVAVTDASGKFEQHVLRLGHYSLSISPPAGIKPPGPETGSDQVRVWTSVYYPGVALPEAAARIAVHPGDRISGVDLKLLAVPAHVIRGMLLNPDGTPASDVTVALNIDEPPGVPGEKERPTCEARTNSEGSFEFPPVADGDWRIAAELERGGVTLRALQWVEIAGHDVRDVKLRLAAPFNVQGLVVMDTTANGMKATAAAPKPPAVSLIPHAGRVRSGSGAASWMLQPESMAKPRFRSVLYEGDGAVTANPDSDGNFIFNGVYADGYRIAPLAGPAGFYLDSVRVGETDVAAAEVQVSPATLPITVVYKTGGGVVRGAVEKCASGAVVLIPADTNMRWFGFLHSVRCDGKDHYEIGAVRPGEYFAVAFAGSDSTPSADAGVLQQARRVTVKAGEAVTVDLSAIPE